LSAVNDAPVNTTPAAQNTAEDTPLVLSVANGNAIVISDVDAGSNPVRVTIGAAHGVLTLAGTTNLTFLTGDGTADATIAFTGTLTDINAALDGLQYDPATGYVGSDTLTVTADDQGNTGDGGSLSTSNTVAINVDYVNAAPVLSGANDLTAIAEDALANPGTLVSALIAGHVSDADAGALRGIAVTAVDDSHGTWEYSTNAGGAWTAFGSLSESSARLLAADANTYVRFVPDANWNGTVMGGITFRAWDQTSGTAGSTADASSNGGTTAFSSATASASITVRTRR
jgi:hypothetical protein